MDEIANNAINTDASSQIDILRASATDKTTPTLDTNNVESCSIIVEASTSDSDEGNEAIFVEAERSNFSSQYFIEM